MISKIHEIRGVGTFELFQPESPVDLGKLNLVFSENGKGKSTLADMFRSMKSNEVERLIGRSSIGSTDQYVSIQVDRNTVVFENGNWTPRYNQVIVFDEVFVYENVYEGLHVDRAHKQRLFEVVIGSSAIGERLRRDELTNRIADRRSKIRGLKELITLSIPHPENSSFDALTFGEFLELERVDDVRQQIELETKLLEKRMHDDVLQKIETFQPLSLPTPPLFQLATLLNRSFQYIETNAEQRIRDHLADYGSVNVEDWVEMGTRYVRDSGQRCPFCGQSLHSSHLIQHYQAYFSKAYKQLKQDVIDFPKTHLDVQNLMMN